jgi:hypothetical protein
MVWIAVQIAAALGAFVGVLDLISRRSKRAVRLLLAAALVLGGPPAYRAFTAPAVGEGRSLLKSAVCPALPTPRLRQQCRAEIDVPAVPAVVVPKR